MKLKVTNVGTQVTTLAGEDVAACLDPGASADIDGEANVLVYGPKPGVKDQFKQAFQTLKGFLSGHKPAENVDVAATITNMGDQPIRVILGDGVTDYELHPGNTYSATAQYLELRELGNAPQQGGTPD